MEGCPCVNERQIVNERLLILEQQKQDVALCLDEVLNTGRAWVLDHDKSVGSGFEEVHQLIVDTSQLVANFCSQMPVLSCNKESVSRGKVTVLESAAISETPRRMEDSVLQQEHSNELDGLKEHMKQINEGHKKTVVEMDKRISDLEQSVHNLIKELSDNKTQVCSELKKRETHEDGKKRDGDLLCKLTTDVENMQEKFKELTTQAGCWQSLENNKQFKSLQKQVKSQDKKISALCDKEIRLKELLEHLPRKVTSNADAIASLSSQQKKGLDKLERLEREIEAVQRKFDVTLKKCEQISRDVEARERKLEELLQSSASVLSLPETTSRKDWIGFAAKLHGDWLLKKNKMTLLKEGNILNFTIIFDRGFCFDPAVGKFTVPRDGVYLICVTMHQYHDGQVLLHVTKQPDRCARAESYSLFSHKHCLLEASTSEDLGRDCLFSFMEMKGGDDLYVTVVAVKDNPLLTDSTIFSCFLLS